METKPDPCPFCGGTDIRPSLLGDGFAALYCASCRVVGPAVKVIADDAFCTVDARLAAAWNRRAPGPEVYHGDAPFWVAETKPGRFYRFTECAGRGDCSDLTLAERYLSEAHVRHVWGDGAVPRQVVVRHLLVAASETPEAADG